MQRSYVWLRSHPFWAGCILAILYLVVLQRSWLFSGDLWAENQAEYLDEAVRFGFSETIMPNWAGYLTIVPSLLSKLYVALEGPLGYSDYFYRLVDVAFIVLCSGGILSASRGIIKPYGGRILLTLGCLLIITDPTMATFCNIWYFGFIPLILVGLNNQPYTKRSQIGYAASGFALALSKPSVLLLLPFLWRTYKTKEYTACLVVIAAALAQTLIMFVADPRGVTANTNQEIWTIVQAVFTGSGVALFKIFQLAPQSLSDLYIANLLLLLILGLAAKRLGVVRSAILVALYVFSIYFFVLAPDAPVFDTVQTFQAISTYTYKAQRELPIYTMLILLGGAACASMWPEKTLKSRQRIQPSTIRLYLLLVCVIALGALYQPITGNTPGMHVNSDSFRADLTNKQPVCLPIPPTMLYLPQTNWIFGYQTYCANPQAKLTLSQTYIAPPDEVVLHSYYALPLKTVGLIVLPERPNISTTITITNRITNQVYVSNIDASSQAMQLAIFNTGNLRDAGTDFTWQITASQPIKIGTFQNGEPAIYGYFGVNE